MKKASIALIALLVASQAVAAEKKVAAPPPSAPEIEPDWADIRAKGEAILKGPLFDPSSAQFEWTEGFRWGWVQPMFGKKVYQWVGCGKLNAKNRMGGYVGAKKFYVAATTDGKIRAGYPEDLEPASCLFPTLGHVDPQPELLAIANPGGTASVADELEKLAALRDKGILSPAEFDQQKAKLLSK